MFMDQDLERILICGTEAGISDIYLEPGKPVFWRRHGSLMPLMEYMPTQEDLYRIFSKLAADDIREDYEYGYPVTFSVDIDGFKHRADVTRSNGMLSMHFHATSRFIPPLEDLGEIGRIADKINVKRGGLFLIGGGLNSGKTTTAYSILNMLGQKDFYRIITMTNAMEYELVKCRSMISQRTYGKDYEDLAAAICHAAKENPDIVYIEHLDTSKAVENACKLAESGCFVITEYTGIFRSAHHMYLDFIEYEYNTSGDYSHNLFAGILYQELKPCTRGGMVAAISYETDDRDDCISLDESIARLKDSKLIKEEFENEDN